MKKMLKIIILVSISCVSCMTRAPSDYELDMRAGRLPKKLDTNQYKSVVKEMHTVQGLKKSSIDPIRTEPRIEKVWIYNQEINDGTYLQGTYVFFQVDNGFWINPSDQKL